MDIINHQSNGAKGLRIAASVCVVLGWIALAVGFILACAYSDEVIFIFPILAGAVGLGVMYLLACSVRALASLAEAAQMYFNNNAAAEDIEE